MREDCLRGILLVAHAEVVTGRRGHEGRICDLRLRIVCCRQINAAGAGEGQDITLQSVRQNSGPVRQDGAHSVVRRDTDEALATTNKSATAYSSHPSHFV